MNIYIYIYIPRSAPEVEQHYSSSRQIVRSTTVRISNKKKPCKKRPVSVPSAHAMRTAPELAFPTGHANGSGQPRSAPCPSGGQ